VLAEHVVRMRSTITMAGLLYMIMFGEFGFADDLSLVDLQGKSIDAQYTRTEQYRRLNVDNDSWKSYSIILEFLRTGWRRSLMGSAAFTRTLPSRQWCPRAPNSVATGASTALEPRLLCPYSSPLPRYRATRSAQDCSPSGGCRLPTVGRVSATTKWRVETPDLV
jgi:hypothetical protein